jgi:serine/threonine-protein kinase
LESGAWHELERAVERFERAWEDGSRPTLDDYLPADSTVRSALVIELAHAELEYRLRAGEPARAEDYLSKYPELRSSPAAVELIAAEHDIRSRQESAVTVADFLKRFPEYESELRARLEPVPATTMTLPPAGQTSQAALETSVPQAGDESGDSAAKGSGENAVRVRLRAPRDEADPPLRHPAATLPDHAGRCAILGEIARGGMGAVLKGHDPELGRELAVKILLEKYEDQPELTRRFLVEAQISGQLQHPGIVPVYDVGLLLDRRPYFTMKLIRGRTLAALLAERRQPGHDLPRFLKIFEQVCQTLAYAHARGVIHRDLKPMNVMVGAFGEVQVMDWGLAKVLSAAGVAEVSATSATAMGDGETRAGSVVGTPAYMPPEQARGDTAQLDERSDVFGLGGILCEVLTGSPPYTNPSRQLVFRQAEQGKLDDAFRRLDACGADGELVRLAKQCLAAAAADRPRDAGVVAKEITAYLTGVQERLRAAEVERAAAEAKAHEARAKIAAERRAKRLTIGLAAAVLLTAAIGGGAGLWIKKQWDDRAAERLAEENRRETERAAEEVRQAAETARQIDQTDRDVSVALQEAATLRAEGRRHTNRLAKWLAALTDADSALRRAEGFLAKGIATDELRQRLRTARADWQADDKDRRMVERLDNIHLDMYLNFDEQAGLPLVDARYARAFREYGIDVDKLEPKAAAALIQARPIRSHLAGALDHWGLVRDRGMVAPEHGPGGVRHLMDVARLADPTPWRTEFYDMVTKNHLDRLDDLAARADLSEMPITTVSVLAFGLFVRNRRGDVDLAVSLVRRAQQHHPDNFILTYEVGWSYGVSQQWDEQIGFYTAAVSLRPDSPCAHCALGIAQAARGQRDEGIASIQRSLKLRPKFARAHVALSIIYREKGNTDQALTEMRKALDIDSKPRYLDELAMLLALKDVRAEARKAFDAAIKADPNRAKTYHNLGYVLASWELLDEAVKNYRKAIELDPKLARTHDLLAQCLERQGKLEDAGIAFHVGLIQAPEDSQLRVDYAMFLWRTKGDAVALAEIEDVIASQPFRWWAYYCKGLILESRRDVPGALAAFRRAANGNPGDARTHYRLGMLLTQQGSITEAVDQLRQAHRLAPTEALFCCRLGWFLYRNQEVDEAIRMLRRSIVLDKNRADTHISLGIVLGESGQEKEAVRELEIASHLPLKDATAHANLGVGLAKHGKLEQGIDHFRQALTLEPGNPLWPFQLAEALRGAWRFKEALPHYRQAEKLAAQNSGFLNAIRAKRSECQQFADLDDKFDAILNGEMKLDRAGDLFKFAGLCMSKKRYAAGTRFSRDAFAADPSLADNLASTARYSAARAAALAGSGQGKDAADLDDAERADLRKQALEWLRADLERLTKELKRNPQVRIALLRAVQGWQREKDLADLRDPDALKKLPKDEREAWTKLWADVQRLLASTRNAK